MVGISILSYFGCTTGRKFEKKGEFVLQILEVKHSNFASIDCIELGYILIQLLDPSDCEIECSM